jgi:carbon monoxide dehydrogenase subunit G
VSGRLASVAGGMLEPLARKNIERFINAVQARLKG